ncbi:MAG: LamG-like jellyroll fold domain-containing protein [Bacteroidia bacterium]
MIKKLLSTLALLALIPLSSTAQTVSTEDFETETGGSTSFTDNGQVFNITTQAQGPFDIDAAYPGTGWNGTTNDNRYIDNDGFAVAGLGTGFTISSSGSVPFNIKSVWMYLADNTANVNVSGALTIVGKLGGVTKFTASATSPFNNTSVSTNNGFTLIDFTTFGGSNNASTNIDQLVFSTTPNFTYVGLDAFKWSTVCPTVSVSPVSQTNVSCNGSSNGAASVTASGGSGFTYNWTPGSPTGDGTASVTGLTAGGWTCTVTNSCSNSGVALFTITQPTSAVTATTTQTNVACNGGSNGIASVSASGGTSGYTYSWAPSGGTGATASSLSAINYTCTITDANSCSITKTFSITQPAAISATTTQTNVACNGGSNGVASVSASGGTGSLTYNWSPSGGTASTASGLSASNYTCTIKDGNNCAITKTFTINQPSALVLTVASQTNVTTFGGNNGAASVNNATGGAGSYTYDWTPGNPTGDGTTTASNLTAGTWSCTVTDANSCSATQTFTITQPAAGPAAALNFDGADDAISIADNAALDISQQITLEAWVYAAPGGNGIQNVISKSTCGSNNNGYIFPRTDDSWNNFIGYFFINGGWQTLSAPFAGLNQWHHLAATYDGSYIRIYQDGVLAATSSLIVGSIQTNLNPLTLGSQPGCGEFFKGSLDEARVWNRALCAGEIQNNMNGELTVPQSGLVAYYRFNEGSAGANNAGITIATDSSGNGLDGTLNGFVLNGTGSNWIAPGAVTTGSMVSTYTLPVACINSNTPVCENQYLNFTSCSSGASTYNWSGPASFSSTQASPAISNVSLSNDGTYTLTVSDMYGCSASTTASVTVNPAPVVNTLTGNVTVCGDVSTTFSVSTTGISMYQWVYENVAPLPFDSAAITGLYSETGYNTPALTITQPYSQNYDHYAVYCIVTNSLNCSTVSAPDTIYANALPNVTANITSATVCAGSPDTLVASGAATYTWSSNANNTVGDSAFVSPTVNDTYTVTGTDTATGCVNTATISVAVNTCGTGIKGMNQTSLSVYPNPNNGTFSISSETEIGAVQIFNALGAEVYKTTVRDNQALIDLGNQPSGIYYVIAQGRKVTISKQ